MSNNEPNTRICIAIIDGDPHPYEVSVDHGDESEYWAMYFDTLGKTVSVARTYAKSRPFGRCEVWLPTGAIYTKEDKLELVGCYLSGY